MDSRFASSWLKVDRAKHHINELNIRIAAYNERKPHRLVVEQDPQGSNHLWTIRIREAIPEDLPLLIGDAIHNLRASIDHLIYRSVVLNRHTPTTMTAFPFWGERETLDAAIKRRHVADAGADVV